LIWFDGAFEPYAIRATKPHWVEKMGFDWWNMQPIAKSVASIFNTSDWDVGGVIGNDQ